MLWDTETSNKLHIIKPQLGNWPPISKISGLRSSVDLELATHMAHTRTCWLLVSHLSVVNVAQR